MRVLGIINKEDNLKGYIKKFRGYLEEIKC